VPNEGTTAEVEADPGYPQPGTAQEPRFWGTHAHALDAKGRVVLPARFREPFRQGAFITKLNDGCLGVFTPLEFQRRTVAMIEKGRQGPQERNVARVWAAGAFDTTPDGQGRLPIPPQLRAYAHLENEVVINGAINHLEIWSADEWEAVDAEGSESMQSGTDLLDDFGF
jgi:MraZ protein